MSMASMQETMQRRIAEAAREAETSPEVRAAITAIAGDNSAAAQRMLTEGPTDAELSRIWDRATHQGALDDQILFLAGTSLFHVYKQRLETAMETLRAAIEEEKRANSPSPGDKP